MIDNVFRISFAAYFWTPIPFVFLLAIALLKGCIASRLLKNQIFNNRIIVTVVISNITGYFIEYFLSVYLNGGNIMLVWIPWVKIIGTRDLLNYLVSFPLIFIVTLLVESTINWLLLKSYFTMAKLFKTTLCINFISLILLIIVFNLILFNFIKGEEVGIINDYLPPIK